MFSNHRELGTGNLVGLLDGWVYEVLFVGGVDERKELLSRVGVIYFFIFIFFLGDTMVLIGDSGQSGLCYLGGGVNKLTDLPVPLFVFEEIPHVEPQTRHLRYKTQKLLT